MKKSAVAKARERYERAYRALKEAEISKNHKEFESAWSDMLLAGNGVHTILEQGAKTNLQSRQWFGGKKRQRRADPLLSYMHQARNAFEHGLGPITPIANSMSARIFRDAPEGTTPAVTVRLGQPTMFPVIDERFGEAFWPPLSFLGAALDHPTPLEVAKLWLKYLDDLLKEAAEMPD